MAKKGNSFIKFVFKSKLRKDACAIRVMVSLQKQLPLKEGKKGVSGKCRHVPNHSICAINQGNQVLLFAKNYFLKGESNKFLQNIRLIPNSGNYLNGWMQLSSIPSRRMRRISKKKKKGSLAESSSAGCKQSLAENTSSVSTNYLFKEKKNGNVDYRSVFQSQS